MLTNKLGDSPQDNVRSRVAEGSTYWLPHHNCSSSPYMVMETLEKGRQELLIALPDSHPGVNPLM